MKHRQRIAIFACVTALAFACAPRQGLTTSALVLSEAPASAPMRAGYLSITNHGPDTRTLVAAQSAQFGLVEFHITQTVDGVARMRQEQTLTIAPGTTLKFEPLGRHLMLMQPRAQNADAVAVTLCFADGECVTSAVAGN